uniref:Uncharacterized protein n=1 Tax=viral metagenome TaxID=1070528 RepID=A0A6C0HA18_9ZZZZ
MPEIFKFFQYPTTTSKELEKFNTTIDTSKDKENKSQFVQRQTPEYKDYRDLPKPDEGELFKALHPDKGGRRHKKTQRRRKRKTQTQKRKHGKSKRRRRM